MKKIILWILGIILIIGIVEYIKDPESFNNNITNNIITETNSINETNNNIIVTNTIENLTNNVNNTANEFNNTLENEINSKDDMKKKQYANLEQICKQLYPYGYSLGLDYKQIGESDKSYWGYITIKNAYGTKAKYEYSVWYNDDNTVSELVVNNVKVY